ncbi:hypothetical protein V7S43_000259 [Phytophthora oleae]|uniref:PUB domain-containing protein n=1 Tax=Phytophthora oleae TaxID=2107226 RepID=A0ABD3G938_9STRA
MLSGKADQLLANANYLLELGVPQERLPRVITSVPECLALTPSRIKKTVDMLDEMFGNGVGIRAVSNSRIVLYNIDNMRESLDFLVSLGFTTERIGENPRRITRNVARFLRPRATFLKEQGVNVVEDTSWILKGDRLFIEK